jgi:Uncharacterised nucleotidyltransferase
MAAFAAPSPPTRNVDADPELFKAVFGPEVELELNYLTWRSKIRIEDPFSQSTLELLPLLFARLRAAEMFDDFSGRLKGVSRKVWVQSQYALEDVFEAIERLEQHRVPVILQGCGALAALHPDQVRFAAHERIDLIVQASSLGEALQILIGMGWKPQAWVHHVNRFEADAIDLFNDRWRCLRLSWRTFVGLGTPARNREVWDRMLKAQNNGRSFTVLAPMDRLVQSLATPTETKFFELCLVFRHFVKQDADWDQLQVQLTELGARARTVNRLEELMQVFDLSQSRRLIAGLVQCEITLAERVQHWQDRRSSSPMDQRLYRAANFICRKLREKPQQHVGHLLFAIISYLGFRGTPVRWRPETVEIDKISKLAAGMERAQ